MGVSITFKPTLQPDGCYYIDMSGWDYMVAQPFASGDDMTVYITNDGGEITGSVGNAAITATNFQFTNQYKDLTNGNIGASSGMEVGKLWKMDNMGRYVKFEPKGVSPAPIDALIMLYKKG